MSFPEKVKTVFEKYGMTELKSYHMLNLYDDVLDCYAEDQKERKQKLKKILEDYHKYKNGVFLDVPNDEPPTFMSGAYCNCARWLERQFEELKE